MLLGKYPRVNIRAVIIEAWGERAGAAGLSGHRHVPRAWAGEEWLLQLHAWGPLPVSHRDIHPVVAKTG